MYLQTSDMFYVATCVRTLLQDGAYAVWQRMIKAGVVPDEVTQRILVQCFRNNLQMASALVKEARQLRVRCTANLSLQSCYTSLHSVDPTQQVANYHTIPMQQVVPLEHQSHRHNTTWCAYCIHPWRRHFALIKPAIILQVSLSKVIYTQNGATCLLQMAAEADPTKPKIMPKKGIVRGQQTSQVHIMEGSIDNRGPFVLDLHGLSKPAAQLALQHVRCTEELLLHAHCTLALSCSQHQQTLSYGV